VKGFKEGMKDAGDSASGTTPSQDKLGQTIDVKPEEKSKV